MAADRKICPFCQERDFSRVHRKIWMRLIPFSRLYQCNMCLQTYFVISLKNVENKESHTRK